MSGFFTSSFVLTEVTTMSVSRAIGSILLFILLTVPGAAHAVQSVADTPFVQEYAEHHRVGKTADENDVRAIAVDKEGRVWAATKAGIYALEKGTWKKTMSQQEAGPTYDVVVDNSGTVWVGAWNGLYRFAKGTLHKVNGISVPIAVLCESKGEVICAGPDGMWRGSGEKWAQMKGNWASSVRAIVPDPHEGIWIATSIGLYHDTDRMDALYHTSDELLSSNLRALAVSSDSRLRIGGTGGIDVYESGKRVAHFTGEQGLPCTDVRCLAFTPGGALWAGTGLGVARYDGKNWSLRHSKRWLPDDDVRDIVIPEHDTAWIATGAGVTTIRGRTMMTLADKADHYLKICLARHVREPYLVERCFLRVPGDTTTFAPMDTDNDGQYTGMYLAMESFRYAVTRDPQARENARKAFHAMEFLQTVTGTQGFVARTVIPSTWARMADPNERISPQEYAERHVIDPRWKKVEPRWRPSADGKWLWKGDTSSDEITGHMFGYLFYYDLAADETEREHVRNLVARIMDYVIDGGFVLKDIDGKATRWAVWSPEKLNRDPDWRPERGVNSVEILSFLKVAYHMTGNEKYQKSYRYLIDKHGYAENTRRAKVTVPSERTHIDDELLALAYPGLLKYETDPELKKIYLEGLNHWYQNIANEYSPFYGFVYGGVVGRDFGFQGCVEFLRDTPLDIVQWTVDNTRREDIKLVRRPELEVLQTDRLLTASERGIIRWDENPWRTIQGDDGRTESSGVFWLLPYWMGRYYGFIEAP